MRRNVQKAIEEGRKISEKRDGLGIYLTEMDQFRDMFTQNIKKHGPEEALFHLIWDVYDMGLAVGMRNGKKREVAR